MAQRVHRRFDRHRALGESRHGRMQHVCPAKDQNQPDGAQLDIGCIMGLVYSGYKGVCDIWRRNPAGCLHACPRQPSIDDRLGAYADVLIQDSQNGVGACSDERTARYSDAASAALLPYRILQYASYTTNHPCVPLPPTHARSLAARKIRR